VLAAYEANNTGKRVSFPYHGNPGPAKWTR
jgi:hypothetical protein